MVCVHAICRVHWYAFIFHAFCDAHTSTFFCRNMQNIINISYIIFCVILCNWSQDLTNTKNAVKIAKQCPLMTRVHTNQINFKILLLIIIIYILHIKFYMIPCNKRDLFQWLWKTSAHIELHAQKFNQHQFLDIRSWTSAATRSVSHRQIFSYNRGAKDYGLHQLVF